MEQDSINQRLKFLAENLAESARAFSDALGESPTNTHNYISGGRKPAPEYLKKILLHYRNINAHWLLTGEGDPFLPGVAEPTVNYQKKNKGTTVGTNYGGIASQPPSEKDDCKKDLAAAQHTIALLSAQLLDKERIIQLYERQTPAPK